jgi:hypothetical protein
MNNLFIIIPAIVVGIILLYSGLKGALHIEEEEDPFAMQEDAKFEPRKVIDLSKGTLGTDPVIAPKKKYYKKKKKKPAIANNAPVDKKPVGRPKKAE